MSHESPKKKSVKRWQEKKGKPNKRKEREKRKEKRGKKWREKISEQEKDDKMEGLGEKSLPLFMW